MTYREKVSMGGHLKSWIGVKTVSRFVTKDGQRIPNPEWRPYAATISKADVNKGYKPRKDEYAPSQQSTKTTFVILGSFYTHLINENLTEINPVLQIRQKSKFLRTQQGSPKIPRLSEIQWKCLIDTTRILAEENPDRHQRTLFIITAMYLMYLRISEFVASSRWTPVMGHFYKDSRDNWWFITVGKSNKERHVTVSKGMIEALKKWRKHLGLSLLPSPQDQFPLLPKTKGKGAVTSIRMLRQLIQECFDATTQELLKKGEKEEAETMVMETVHWLRHTGISDDINKHGRPIIHVRDDAGHASIATTDRYNDVILRERHSSGKNKQV
jgi:site-specific recombinase XerD